MDALSNAESTSIVIPAYNEGRAVGPLVTALRAAAPWREILVIDDGFLILLKVITIFSPLRIFLPISAVSFAVGAGYALWTIGTQSHVTNSSVLLILFSVVIFLVGLVSEQISSLRAEGRRL